MKAKIFSLFTLIIPIAFSCQTASKPKKPSEQVLNVNFNKEPPTLDPRKGGDIISSTVQFMLFEGLTRMTPYSTTEPAIAEKIDISEDKTIYTFHLRNCSWSDGSPITAWDFESAWKNMLTPKFPCPNAHLLYPIKNAEKVKKGDLPLETLGIKAVDDKTFVVELEKPIPYFLELTSFCVFFPVHHKTAENNPYWADNATDHFVCNGPFKLSKWKKGDQLIVKKNPEYWDEKNVKLDKIFLSFIENETTALQLYEKDELDILGSPFSEIPIDAIPNFLKQKLLSMYPVAGTTILPFNIHKEPFNNLNMRKAFGYAINRKEIIDHITQLDEKVATGMIPPILKKGKETDFFKDGDVKLAKEHFQKALNELGIVKDDLQDITLIYPQSEINQKIAQAIQQQWFSVLGVQTKIQGVDLKNFLDKLSKKDYQLAQYYWYSQYNDAMNILDRFKLRDNPKNYPGWENEEYKHILNQYLTEWDFEKKIELIERAEHIFISDMPLIPIYYCNCAFLQKNYLKSMYVSPIGSIHFGFAYKDLSYASSRDELALHSD